jgi:hypothetical protein
VIFMLRYGALALAVLGQPVAAFEVDLDSAQMHRALGVPPGEALIGERKTAYIFYKCPDDDRHCGGMAGDLAQGEAAWLDASDLCREDGKLMLPARSDISSRAAFGLTVHAARGPGDRFALAVADGVRASHARVARFLGQLAESPSCDRALGWALDRRLFPVSDIDGYPTLSALTSYLLGKEVAP